MIHTFRIQIGLMRFLRGSVIAYANRFFVYGDAGSPFVLKPNHTHKAGLVSFVWLADVLRIAFRAYVTKICKSVVRFVSVNVVNQANRPIAGYVKPNDSVRFINFAADTDSRIAFGVNVSRNIASFDRPTWPNFPNQHASFSAVFKYFSQLFCGNIGLAHLSPPVLSLNVNTGITK